MSPHQRTGHAGSTHSGRARAAAPAKTPPTPAIRLPRWLRHPPAWAVALVLALVHLLLALAVFDPTVFNGGDNAAYLSLARSLLERHTYTSIWEPLAPPHTQYPPVFPGMIALGLLLGLKGFVGMKAIVVACSTAAVALSYLWLRRRRRPGLALGVAAVLALSPGVLAQSHLELSDVPFWAFAMLALWAFERLGRRERLRFALGVVAIVLAYFTRSAGLPLVLAALAWLGWRRRWRQLAILAGVVLPLGFLWWLRGHLAGGSAYGELFWYVDPYRPAAGKIGLGDLFHRMFANERAYLGTHMPVLLAEDVTALLTLISYVITLLGVYGWVMRLRRPQLAEFYLPLYIGLLFVWPEVWAGERFLLPALPLLLAYAGEGLVRLVRRVSRRAALPIGFAATGMLVLLGLPAVRSDASAAAVCRDTVRAGVPLGCLEAPWQDFFDVAAWARAGMPQGSAAFARKPRLFFVYSGHQSHDVPRTKEPARFLAAAREQHIDYIVVDRLGGLTLEYFGPILSAYPNAFCLMYATPDAGAALLRIQPNAPALFAGPPLAGGAQAALGQCPR